METLLKNVIEEFGWAPRDVYLGVFDLPFIRHEHNEAVQQVDHSKLATFATKFRFLRELHPNPLAHNLIAVNPTMVLPSIDSWTVEFKSAWVLGKVMESAWSKED